jgi:hypothetical protein
MTTYFTLKDLTQQLKNNNLPASRPFLNQLEKAGIIPIPQNTVGFKVKEKDNTKTNDMRIYTHDEIQKIIAIVRKYSKLSDADKLLQLNH